MSESDDSLANVPKGTQAIERGLTVLELVSGKPLSIREIVDRTGLSRPTISRIVGALERSGYVARAENEGENNKFRLGTRVLTLSTRWHQQVDIDRISRPHLEELSHNLHETGHVMIREGLHSVCVAFTDSPQSIRLSMAIGDREPVHLGAHGKLLLAHAPAGVAEAVFNRLESTPGSTISVDELKADLEQARRRGFAESYGEIDAGAYSLASPIFAEGGEIAAAIGVSGPVDRMLKIPREELKTRVIHAARSTSADLGYTPGRGMNSWDLSEDPA